MDALTSLRAQMKARRVRPTDLARELDVPKSLVTMWLKRQRRPGLANAHAIETWSGGIIRSADWLVRRPRRRPSKHLPNAA